MISNAERKVAQFSLAAIWIVTGVISIWVYPIKESIALLTSVGIHQEYAESLVLISGFLDIILGILTIVKTSKLLWKLQAILVLGYSLIIALYLPIYLQHPFGPILKNLPILVLIWLLHNNERVRHEPLPTP